MKLIKLFTYILWAPLIFAQSNFNHTQRNIKEYTLTIEKEKLTLGGVTSEGMTVNGTVPGPTLTFTEGDSAIIHVVNKMKVETSVHWHGLLLPNLQDGVPYLTTPPIKSGATYTYRFPIKQSGTYWYHSHTMLQEQRGVYGSIIIYPKKKILDYDKDLVVVLSDWTNEAPLSILKNLKRGSEWYQIKKGTAIPLSKVISRGALGAQLKMWKNRMEGVDIADIYYPTFLTNGKKLADYPNFKPGEKIRLRFINASASTYFWLDFGKANPLLVSADGIDIQPVHKNRLLLSIAETYDFIITLPKGTLEVIATAQDGSGHTTLHLGEGDILPANIITKPDKITMMKSMAKMNMKMGAPAIKINSKKDTSKKLMQNYGMHHMMKGMHKEKSHSMEKMGAMPMEKNKFSTAERKKYFNYDFLKAKTPTSFAKNMPVNNILLNLTGNMNRYIWSLDGVPLSEADDIKIKKGEITRITLNNLTMMHHPMHLHGHYFRIINKNGELSPWKHTVNIPPMQKVTIEFMGNTTGDWLFHCHVLYHMMGGMTRIFSYDSPRNEQMKPYNKATVVNEMDRYFHWGIANVSTNYTEFNWISSNIRNEWNFKGEVDYYKNLELEVSYNRYLNDWVRLYAGINTENINYSTHYHKSTVAKAGIKYFTPYMFYVDLSMDSQLKPSIRINRDLLLFPRTFIEGEYEYTANFGWVKSLKGNQSFEGETKWKIGLEYMLSKNFSLTGNYHNLYGWGGGVSVRF